jgi:hypothetical protein
MPGFLLSHLKISKHAQSKTERGEGEEKTRKSIQKQQDSVVEPD